MVFQPSYTLSHKRLVIRDNNKISQFTFITGIKICSALFSFRIEHLVKLLVVTSTLLNVFSVKVCLRGFYFNRGLISSVSFNIEVDE